MKPLRPWTITYLLMALTVIQTLVIFGMAVLLWPTHPVFAGLSVATSALLGGCVPVVVAAVERAHKENEALRLAALRSRQ